LRTLGISIEDLPVELQRAARLAGFLKILRELQERASAASIPCGLFSRGLYIVFLLRLDVATERQLDRFRIVA
jgi:hypothetical protein